MTQLPNIDFLDKGRTESDLKNKFFSPILDSIAELPGGSGVSELTISSGAITPVAAAHSVDTENDDISDDLERIAVAELPEGRIIMLSCADNSRTVTVKHGMGGWGQVVLHDESDLVLSDTRDRIVLQRKGDNWEEVFRAGPSLQFEAVNPDILKADEPDLLQAVYGDEAQVHAGTNLSALTVARNHISWTLTAASQFSDATLPYDGTYIFHVYPAGNALALAASYKTDGSLADPDSAAGEIRIVVEQYNSRKTIVSLQNMEA